jgi:hypothetical protein
MKTLKFFKKNINRDKVYASVEGYQLDLRPVVEKAKQLHGNHDELPSWAKLVANPKKGKGWFITLLEGMFKGKHNLYGVDIERLVNSDLSDRRVAMMFFPDNTKVDHLVELGKITQETLGGWTIVVLNGKTVKDNSECEDKVKEAIEKNDNNVLIIASKMAQRSFSEELIDELYLAYDRGQDGATIQKMSRALTSNSLDKVARIFSLSFDPNRDDKLDTLIFQAALNQVDKKPNSNIREELKKVYNSIDIFSYDTKLDKTIKLNVDDYVKQALEKKGISRVIGKKYDLFQHNSDEIRAIANGNDNYFRNEIKEKVDTGKTKDTTERNKVLVDQPQITDDDYEKARKVIISIFEHSDKIMKVGKSNGANTLEESLRIIEKNHWTKIIENEYNLRYLIVKTILLRKKNLLNLCNW